MATARRVYLYAIALIALGMLVTGLAGLLQVGLEALVERLAPPAGSVGVADLRGRVSFSGAIALIGLAAWLVHWGLAERTVRREEGLEPAAQARPGTADGAVPSDDPALGPGLPVQPPVGGETSSDLSALSPRLPARPAVGLETSSDDPTLASGLPARPPARRENPERVAAVRKLYLYAVLLLGGWTLTFALRALVGDLLRALFGQLTAVELMAGSVISPASLLLTAGALWVYHRRGAALDRSLAPEVGVGATLRRWWLYGLAFVALLMLLFGAIGLIETLWQTVFVPPGAAAIGRDGLELQVADRVGSIAAGLVVWLLAWRASAAWLARTDDADPEARAVLRKVYLYLVLGIAVTWTTWNLGQILYGLLRVALLGGTGSAGWGGVLNGLGPPVAAAVVFGVAWLYHGRAIRAEARLAGERGQSEGTRATIRWLYEYLVALIGAATLAFGLGGTLATVLDLIAQPGAVRPTNWWQDRISLFATLAAVGLPLWLAWWTPLQREANEPPGGHPARRSLVRRIYLLLAFALTVLTLLTSGAYALYQLMRLALGEVWTAAQTTDLLTAGSAAAVAALLLGYHLRVLRRDGAAAVVDRAAGAPAVAVAIVRAADAEALAAFERVLRRAPAGVQVELRRSDAATAAQVSALTDPGSER